jgi:RNA polymerase sporulation-specific sigma factor
LSSTSRSRTNDVDSPVEEAGDVDLLARARSGDDRALYALLERYRDYARSKARSYYLAGSDRDDVVQEALIGLFKAIRDYDLDQDTPFRAFAELCISRQILTAIKTANRNKHSALNRSISLDAPVRPRDERVGGSVGETLEASRLSDPAELVMSAEAIEEIRDSMTGSLTQLEGDVLKLYMEGKSYEEIALVLGNHAKSIDNALQRVKRKLKRHLDERGALLP